MTMLAETPTANLAWLVLVVIFIILLTVISKTLRQTAIVSDRIALILAICVSLLSVLGIAQQFGIFNVDIDITANSEKIEPNSLDLILIPYTAMALAILLVLLLLAIAWLIKAKANSRFRQHTHDKIKHPTADWQEQLSRPSDTSIAPQKKSESSNNELRKLQ